MFQVRFHGRGGQGVVTAAELLEMDAAGKRPLPDGADLADGDRLQGRPAHVGQDSEDPVQVHGVRARHAVGEQVEPQVRVSGIGRRQVQVSGQAQLAAYLCCANRIFLLSREIMFRAVGAGRSQPRRGKPEAERNPVPRDRSDRVPPRRLTHAVKLPQAHHRPGSGLRSGCDRLAGRVQVQAAHLPGPGPERRVISPVQPAADPGRWPLCRSPASGAGRLPCSPRCFSYAVMPTAIG